VNKGPMAHAALHQLPIIRPILLTAGSDHEMGQQYAIQLCEIFGGDALHDAVPARPTSRERRLLRSYKRAIRAVAPESLEWFKGVAAGSASCGSRIMPQQIMASFCGVPETGRLSAPIPAGDYEGGEGCTGFAAWGTATRSGEAICAGSKDHQPRAEVSLLAFPRSHEGLPFFWNPSRILGGAALGGHPGMNSEGVAYVHHGATCWINCARSVASDAGITMPIAVLHTLRTARSAGEARDLQLSYDNPDGNAGGFWMDRSGGAWIIESRKNPVAVRGPGDCGERDFLYSTNNGLCREVTDCQQTQGKAAEYIPHGGWLADGATISSVGRNLQLWRLLSTHHGKIDTELVKMMWRTPGAPLEHASLEEAEACYEETRGSGWNDSLCNLYNASVGVFELGKRRMHISWGCLSRNAHPFSPKRHYYVPGATRAWYELNLASDPEEVVVLARDRAQRDLYLAYRSLGSLPALQAQSAGIPEVFDRAASSWHAGDVWLTRSSREQRNGRILVLSRAAREFTQSQALARSVRNLIHEPPSLLAHPALRMHKEDSGQPGT